MEYKINGWKPEKLFHFFEDVCAIPRGSGNEREISDFLVEFARARGLEVSQDEAMNVVIKKAGSVGAEGRPPVMLQGHMDMVCDSRAGVDHDFEKDGIDLVVKDGILTANGTTLGADNGVALALMMAVLDDEELVHPPLECVFTTEEEIGLGGAAALDKSQLSARIMINLDSEEEGIATVSCAGGARAHFIRKISREERNGTLVRIRIEGFLGGHSGMDIDKERQNAGLLAARIAERLMREGDAGIVVFSGGTKDNAIIRECEVSLVFSDSKDAARAEKAACDMAEAIEEETAPFEPDISWEVSAEEGAAVLALTREDSRALTGLLRLAPNGVFRRNLHMDRFVEASSNIGIIQAEEDRLVIVAAPRSCSASLQKDTKARFAVLAETFGFELTYTGEYPGWDYQEDSRIREVFRESYRELTGKELKVEAIHAGLECGLFTGAIPGLDAISVGPQLENVHTPDESMSLESFAEFYELLKKVLAAI